MHREVVGRITIVQEDRIRLVTDDGRGYLFVVRKRAARIDELEQWRDQAIPVRVRYSGTPDAGAVVECVHGAARRVCGLLGRRGRTRSLARARTGLAPCDGPHTRLR